MTKLKKVILSRQAGKDLSKVPRHILKMFANWLKDIEELGLDDVRKIPGYHDEPCKGKLVGLRSIRLTRSYRAYYRIEFGVVEFIFVERVDKHVY